MSDRFDRNIRLFGQQGQDKLRGGSVAVVGVGGLGTHVVQQLALLGVGSLTLIDGEVLEKTNLNRYVGVCHDDIGCWKVDLAERLVHCVDPRVVVSKIPRPLLSKEAFDAVKTADYTFGCLDNEGGRLVLTELCSAYDRPFVDVASDVDMGPPFVYGGQVCVAWSGAGCLVCLNVLNLQEAREDLETREVRADRETIYGVRRDALGISGPSVVSLNGVAASLAVTEFMVAVTGLRQPTQLLTYRGQSGIVSVNIDPPAADCYYCKGIRGHPKVANVERYLGSAGKPTP